MTRSLPPRPSLRFLQEQAKDLLKAQRYRDAAACPTLRLLRRFNNASDAEILSSRVALHEAQFALAMDYGLPSWAELRRQVRGAQPEKPYSLEAVLLRSRQEVPEYAGAGVPLAVVAALNHAGEDIDYMDFVAASGWAFSFGYKYDDISQAFLAVRGDPKQDGPTEVFAFLPTRLGYGYEMARTRRLEELWPFVVKHVDAGTPIMSEHLDGGLITAYRTADGYRQVWLDGTAGDPAWVDAAKLQPYAVYVLVRQGEPAPAEQIFAEALARAVQKGSPHEWRGAPQGLAALKAYLADLADASKDFAKTPEWFCWAAFSRLTARRCAAVWLESIAKAAGGQAAKHLSAAARRYQAAYECYEQFRSTVQAGEPTDENLQQRARTPGRIAAIAPVLDKGIAEESAGLDALRQAASLIKTA